MTEKTISDDKLHNEGWGWPYVIEIWEDYKLLAIWFAIKTIFMYIWGVIIGIFKFIDKITNIPFIGKIYNEGYKPLLYMSIHWPKATLTVLLIVFLAAMTQPPKIYFDPTLVDADIETMLHELHPDRAEHELTKERFVLFNELIIPIICNECENGVFNVTALNFIYDLGKYIETLKIMKGEGDDAKNEGVYAPDVGILSNVEVIYYTEDGTSQRPPIQAGHISTKKEALEIRKNVMKNAFLRGSMIDNTGTKMALMVPVIEKKHAMPIAAKIMTWVEQNKPASLTHLHVGVSGLVAANATFSKEMYNVLAYMSPVIFVWMLILLVVFVKFKWLIPLPFMLMIADIGYIAGLFIYNGNTVTLMSSMGPVFMAGFNVLDSIYFVLFFSAGLVLYETREEALLWLAKILWKPMFLTTLTTSTGFFILMGSVSPPIAKFGGYTGLSVPLALVLSFLLLTSFIMVMPQSAIENIRKKAREAENEEKGDRLWKEIQSVNQDLCQWSRDNPMKPIMFWVSLTFICLIAGIQNGVIDDSGDKWLAGHHDFRKNLDIYQEAGAVFKIRQRLYTVNSKAEIQELANEMKTLIHDKGLSKNIGEIDTLAYNSKSKLEFITALKRIVDNAADTEETLEEEEAIDELSDYVYNKETQMGVWTNPAMLAWLEKYIEHMNALQNITKTNSFLSMLKMVYRDWEGRGDEAYFRIPPNKKGLLDMVTVIQDGMNTDDLFHCVTDNYGETLINFQLVSADRVPVSEIVQRSNEYIANNPAPILVQSSWSDMSYLQKRMIEDIVLDEIESFIACLLFFAFMFYKGFRNMAQVILSMSVMVMTQIIIFGMTGLTGEAINLPMIILAPVALSACIDIPTHVMSAIKENNEEKHEWFYGVFAGHTGKAIFVNAVLVSLIFMPMGVHALLTLEPYYDVAEFMFKNMAISYLMVITIFPAYFGMMESQKWNNDLRGAFAKFGANRDPVQLAIAIIEEEEYDETKQKEIKAEIIAKASKY